MADTPKTRLLLVDDDSDLREVLSQTLLIGYFETFATADAYVDVSQLVSSMKFAKTPSFIFTSVSSNTARTPSRSSISRYRWSRKKRPLGIGSVSNLRCSFTSVPSTISFRKQMFARKHVLL